MQQLVEVVQQPFAILVVIVVYGLTQAMPLVRSVAAAAPWMWRCELVEVSVVEEESSGY